MPKQTAFGIDFGTTNTRVAYYDGHRLRMVPFITAAGQSFQLPTLVSYRNGEPVAFGADARRHQKEGLPPQPLKWLLGGDLPIEIEGSKLEPIEIVADFFRHLKTLVGRVVKAERLEKAALTIPVHYPPKAREQLQEACQKAGIEITSFFFEPIAAIYCSLTARPVSGVTAVFDWGGGSLDIATVQITDNVAMTREFEGWHRGGTDFDRVLCEQAVNDFLLRQPQFHHTAEVILDHMVVGRSLRLLAETAKERLSAAQQASISFSGFLGSANLLYPITRAQFEGLIETDIVGAVKRLEHALHATGTSPSLLARLFLSGGTCNIPKIKDCLAGRFGDRIVSRLELPSALRHVGLGSDGTSDIGNATAMGAALLAVHGADPVFSNSVGVRLADAAGDQFCPIFQAREPLAFGKREMKFFVSDASSGVARLLVCEQTDTALQPAGRLLRVIPVPIDKSENWLNVGFTLDRHLLLKIEANGVKAKSQSTEPVWVQHLSLGFRLPPRPEMASQAAENVRTWGSVNVLGRNCAMLRLGLSNLQLRSNLLPEDYQGVYSHRLGRKVSECITVHEVKDIKRRNPILILELTEEQQREWRTGLFDGDTTVSMAEGDRHRAWFEQLAENMEDVIASLEDRADCERAFEVLCVAESLAGPGLDSTYATKAVLWAERVRAILDRSEFRLTPQMIDDRLTQTLGDNGWRRARGQAGVSSALQAVVSS